MRHGKGVQWLYWLKPMQSPTEFFITSDLTSSNSGEEYSTNLAYSFYFIFCSHLVYRSEIVLAIRVQGLEGNISLRYL